MSVVRRQRQDDGSVVVFTDATCPNCDDTLVLKQTSENDLEDILEKYEAAYDRTVPEDALEGYDQPVYVFCDARECPYHGLFDRTEVTGS